MGARIALVDDQELVRRGMAALLGLFADLDLVATCDSGAALLGLLDRGGTEPDLVLVDARMPRMSGMELIAELRARRPELRILTLSTFDDDEVVLGSLRAGADGFLLKDASPAELHAAIMTVLDGGTAIDPRVGHQVLRALRGSQPPERPGADQLTERELAVVDLVATGASNRMIAEQLFLSEGTVKNHVSTVLRKLDLHTRTELALWARG